MVLFPGGGLMLPEASTRNPIAVARAFFERFPKLFGTGDPASQLAGCGKTRVLMSGHGE
jgi:hypothetical protein